MEKSNTPSPLFVYYGEQSLLKEKKTVFFSPYDAPDTSFGAIRRWISTLLPGRDCIVCGNSTGIERYTLRLLLQKGFSVILPLATVIPSCLEELNLGWKLTDEQTVGILNKALEEKRLLMVASTGNVSVSVPTGQTMRVRNFWMRWVGNHFVLSAAEQSKDYFGHLLKGREVEVLCS